MRGSTSATRRSGSSLIRAVLTSASAEGRVLGTPSGTPPRSSALETRARYPLDYLALEEEEDDQQRQATKHGRGHDLGVVDAVGALHRRQTYWYGHHVRPRQGDKRPQP